MSKNRCRNLDAPNFYLEIQVDILKPMAQKCDIGVQFDQLVFADANVQCRLDCFESSTPQQNACESELSDANEDLDTSYAQSQVRRKCEKLST